MKSSIEIENKIKELKPILSQKYFVDKTGYFGSYSGNEQKEDSDIDILVLFRKPLGWKFFDLQELLENELKLKVDLYGCGPLQLSNNLKGKHSATAYYSHTAR